ncbi:MAG: hypothetical protein ACTS2F_25060 [Thainema sp.]
MLAAQTAALWRCDISASAIAERFEYVREQDNPFLALFPHRYDYIYAPFPETGCKPNWHTESRHPLSDRIIQQGGYLYGVRFGSTTSYALLDIDITSPYHPQRDSFAVSRIMVALEPLGLVRSVICTSSNSGGLHLYFPFTQALPSWKLARVMAHMLQQAGFKLYPGQLELFPNPKSYNRAGKPTLYHAHRLPLQIGSYLLNADLQPIWSSSDTFVRQWHSARQANTLETKTLTRYLKQTWQGFQPISGGAKKFIQDLNAEIEAGWSSYGQTNRLLGRIAMRAYIFHHILHGGEPLAGPALVNQIVAVAQSLPGYKEWCQHQHEIAQRAADWARSVEKSHYFHYGLHYELHYKDVTTKLGLENTPKPRSDWNQQQFDQTRNKIQNAVLEMQKLDQFPDRATERFNKLTKVYGIGGSSLYRHLDLWHPKEFKVPNAAQNIEECWKQNLAIESLRSLDDVKVARTQDLENLNIDLNKGLNLEIWSLDGLSLSFNDLNDLSLDLDNLNLDLDSLRSLKSLNRAETLKNLNEIKDSNPDWLVNICNNLSAKDRTQLDLRYTNCTSLLQLSGCNPKRDKTLAAIPLLQFSQFQGCNFGHNLNHDFSRYIEQLTAIESPESSELPIELSILRQCQLGMLRLTGIVRSQFETCFSHLTNLPTSVLSKLHSLLPLSPLTTPTDKALSENLDQRIQALIELIHQLPVQSWGNVSPNFALEPRTLSPP